MQTTLSLLAARFDYGGPMYGRRRFRMPPQIRSNPQPSRFDVQLRQANRSIKGSDMMPPEVSPKPEMMPLETSPKPEQQEEQAPVPVPPSAHARNAYRESFMKGYRYLRKAYPQMPQSQLGWVRSNLSHALTENPYMSKRDIKSLVDSLVPHVPEYGTGEEAAA